MREKLIEQKLVKAVKDRDGICLKLACPAFDGIPERCRRCECRNWIVNYSEFHWFPAGPL